MVQGKYGVILYLTEREREREREGEREREREREREGGERNVFICNSTSWITTIQGAKYKIQDNSNRHISYIMYKTTSINRATTTRSSHEIA